MAGLRAYWASACLVVCTWDAGTLGPGGSSRAVTAACLVPRPHPPTPTRLQRQRLGSAPARGCLGNLRCQ